MKKMALDEIGQIFPAFGNGESSLGCPKCRTYICEVLVDRDTSASIEIINRTMATINKAEAAHSAQPAISVPYKRSAKENIALAVFCVAVCYLLKYVILNHFYVFTLGVALFVVFKV
ncbi:hypothetical protein L596_030128 [Steinernema carpocapsae]|uniref:Uncharacterized protein n=1 Tax=Steinernema carpocapsae TaxID=34508 RepID=A0A4U5LRT8_STECR|nr:hypothetical protein L596_030128 [Steinernema carpocapsae]